MRWIPAGALALALACSAIPAVAQPREGTPMAREADRPALDTRSVTGTVKAATDHGFVVLGREEGQKDKEWAFALDSGTAIHAAGQAHAGARLREGDAVTVTYTNRDGKIVAQSVTVTTR